MVTVQDVLSVLEQLAPAEMKMEFDNVGLLVGRREKPVTKILAALDITDWVIEEAKTLGAELIVSHHPVLFSTKSITEDTPEGRHILALAENGIAAICMHTNLDAAEGGVNDALAATLGLCGTKAVAVDGILSDGTPYGIGRVGTLSHAVEFCDFLSETAEKLSAPGLKYYDSGKMVHKVAVVGGSGGSDLPKAIAHGCDTFVTADVKYNVWLEAKEAGINLIDAGHFCTENTVVPVLREKLQAAFADVCVKISENHGPTAQFFVR